MDFISYDQLEIKSPKREGGGLKTKKKLKKTKNVHVAKHYAKGEIKQDQHLCDFCGKIGCSIGLELTSGKGRNANYGPKSDCKLLINKFMGIFY